MHAAETRRGGDSTHIATHPTGKVLRVATTIVAQHFSGFVSEVASEFARRLNVADLEWVLLPFDKLFTPDHAPFDMAMQVVTITPEREAIVDFSDPYLDVNQALLARKDSPMAAARTLEEVRCCVLGARGGGSGMACIRDFIRPTQPPVESP